MANQNLQVTMLKPSKNRRLGVEGLYSKRPIGTEVQKSHKQKAN